MPCVKSGARAGSLYRNLVAHALTLGASGDRAPVRQQPCKSVLVFTIGSLGNEDSSTFPFLDIQLFREWLSEEVHPTILKGIMGGLVLSPLLVKEI